VLALAQTIFSTLYQPFLTWSSWNDFCESVNSDGENLQRDYAICGLYAPKRFVNFCKSHYLKLL